jgi:hypothetical protein
MRDTGFIAQDVEGDFARARRRRALGQVVARLRREPDDVDVILPFDEVVDALGREGERSLGVHTIPLETIVGTVDRGKEFDRDFRPTTSRTRGRWQQLATAVRRGHDLPPISVYRIGEVHFVRDGHHRVSVYRALGRTSIDAHVTEVRTRVGADRNIRLHDLPLKSEERLFHERVPLPPDARRRIQLRRPDDFGELAEAVEAWGFRLTQEHGEHRTREEVARIWFEEEFTPVVEYLREAGLQMPNTEAEAYMAVACARWRLMRTHDWSGEVWERLTREMR